MSGVLSDALLEQIKAQNKKDLRPSTHFRISSLGHCPRKQVAMRAGLLPTAETSDASLLKMWMGTALGKEIQAALEVGGFLEPTWTERELVWGSYKGHVDGLTRKLPGTDEYGPAIVEIKTSADAAVKRDWQEHYDWQALAYCMAAGMKRAVIFQVGREYGLHREKIALLTPEWEKKILNEVRTVESYWQVYAGNGKLPPCLHNFGWEDKTCPYREEGKEPVVEKKETANWNPFAQTETDRELSDFLDNTQEKK